MSASGYVVLDVDKIIRETDRAFLCRIAGVEVWLPKSQVTDSDDYAVGDEAFTLAITEWLAREKGLGGVE